MNNNNNHKKLVIKPPERYYTKIIMRSNHWTHARQIHFYFIFKSICNAFDAHWILLSGFGVNFIWSVEKHKTLHKRTRKSNHVHFEENHSRSNICNLIDMKLQFQHFYGRNFRVALPQHYFRKSFTNYDWKQEIWFNLQQNIIPLLCYY